MNRLTIYTKPVVLILIFFALGNRDANADEKYRSSWVSDSKYEKIQFQYTRTSDWYQYAFKNNNKKKKFRISYELTGAGLKHPHIGSVVLNPGQTKGGNRHEMALSGDKGGTLQARITRLEEVGNKMAILGDDFAQFEKELSPKEKQDLSNTEIARILKDQESNIKTFAKQRVLSQSPKMQPQKQRIASTPPRSTKKSTAAKKPAPTKKSSLGDIAKQKKDTRNSIANALAKKISPSQNRRLVVMAKVDKNSRQSDDLSTHFRNSNGRGRDRTESGYDPPASHWRWMRIELPINDSKYTDQFTIHQQLGIKETEIRRFHVVAGVYNEQGTLVKSQYKSYRIRGNSHWSLEFNVTVDDGVSIPNAWAGIGSTLIK